MSESTERHLGAFSVSLAVEDLAASRAFYESIGFRTGGGMPEQGWLIMRNGTTVVGLFQKMFPANIMTFNPGWTQAAEPLNAPFEDVREIQARLEAAGIEIVSRAAEGDGPAHCVVTDPDGNTIMFDQHVARYSEE